MSIKRFLCVVFSFVLLVSMLAGCTAGTTAPTTVNSTTKDGTTANTTAGTTGKKIDNFNKTGYPIVPTPITLTVVTNDDTKLEAYPMYQTLAKLTGINTSTEAIGGAGFAEKKALVLASGVLPDIFFGEGLTNVDVANNVRNLVDLAPLIKDYAPNIQSMFFQEPWTEQLARMAGTTNIYGLTGVRPFRPVAMDTWYINKVWLDNVGMTIPTTLDQFEKVLQAFKTQDPNRNGNPNDEVPLVCNGPNAQHQSWRNILGSFGVTNPTYAVAQQVRNGKVEFIYALQGTKEAIQYMRKLYSQGLVYSDLMTAAYGAGIAEMNTKESCRIGVYVNWAYTGLYDEQYVAFPVMTGPTGKREAPTAFPGAIRGKQNLFEISRFNKYPEATMRWIDEFYGEELSVQTFFGSYGVGVEKTSTGYLVKEPPTGTAPDAYKWTIAPADSGPVYINKTLEDKIKAPVQYYGKVKDDAINNPYRQPVDYSFPMVTFPSNVSDEITRLNNDIDAFASTKVAQWITKGGIDTEWDAYLKQLNDMGFKRYLEIYQSAYEAFIKK